MLHDPNALYSFDNNEIYIPLRVLEELDRHKIGGEERNVNARQVTRTLDDLTENGISQEGISLSNGGRLFFLENQDVGGSGDDIILQKALDLYNISNPTLTLFHYFERKIAFDSFVQTLLFRLISGCI